MHATRECATRAMLAAEGVRSLVHSDRGAEHVSFSGFLLTRDELHRYAVEQGMSNLAAETFTDAWVTVPPERAEGWPPERRGYYNLMAADLLLPLEGEGMD